VAVGGPAIASPPESAAPGLAVIIDDLGYSMARGRRAIELPGPVTLAVLPFTPMSAELAALATERGQDVILHQPMQSVYPDARAAPGTLTESMPLASFRRTLELALDTLPQAIGVSNHTGSLLTTQAQPMSWLMAEVSTRGLFFVDSRTTPATVALATAIAAGVPSLRRDVFLDHVLDPAAIAENFERAIGIARRNGHAVLIAHPHDVSMSFLERVLPALSARGVEQVRLKSLVDLRPTNPAVAAQLQNPTSPHTAPGL
jgi:polysaccharide deacetylase 2 family uncharacterized protein YibQ